MLFLLLYVDILFVFGVFGIFFHSLCKCNLLFLRHYVSFFTTRISVLVSFHYYFLFIAKILFPGVFPLRFPLSLQFLFWYTIVTLLYFFYCCVPFFFSFYFSVFLYCLLSLLKLLSLVSFRIYFSLKS